jgi:hypothetical protein
MKSTYLASPEVRLVPTNDPLDAAVRYLPHVAAIHAVPVHGGAPAKLAICGHPADPGATEPFDPGKAPVCPRCVERIGRMSQRPGRGASRVIRSQVNARPSCSEPEFTRFSAMSLARGHNRKKYRKQLIGGIQ